MTQLKRPGAKIGVFLIMVMIVGLLIPQRLEMPVQGATKSDYNPNSFWYYPWGKSVTHKGVDVFAKKGTPIHSSTIGVVLYAGEIGYGGKFAVILGPKWRLHYYAHLDEVKTKPLRFLSKKSMIGTVGNTGNAENTPPHLHYSIATIIPYPWRIDKAKHGYLKMFYLNPIPYLNKTP